MFKIDQEEFKPLEDHPEVKIYILQPSYSIKMEAMSILSEVPADGPKTSVKEMMAYWQHLVLKCVKRVEGIFVGDKEIKTAQELLDLGPEEIVGPLIERLGELSRLSQADKKK